MENSFEKDVLRNLKVSKHTYQLVKANIKEILTKNNILDENDKLSDGKKY